jgi:hypothetical protein
MVIMALVPGRATAVLVVVVPVHESPNLPKRSSSKGSTSSAVLDVLVVVSFDDCSGT